MIGVFDSGHGGLTVVRALVDRFPDRSFLYYGMVAFVFAAGCPGTQVT
jgi:glutamate racemase